MTDYIDKTVRLKWRCVLRTGVSVCVAAVSLAAPAALHAEEPRLPAGHTVRQGSSVRELPNDSTDVLGLGILLPSEADSLSGGLPVDSPELVLLAPEDEAKRLEKAASLRVFNPDPTRAVWLAALCPGLGQLYNRRYWKLPIIVGGFMGLGYGASWNNSQLREYTRAYADLLDKDPSTRSYMDFFAPNVQESSLDREWLTRLLRSRRNYFRRNRDLCIIGMVGVYLLAIVDAYVDASLAHFDITPDLSMDLAPTVMQDGRSTRPSVGMLWALNF